MKYLLLYIAFSASLVSCSEGSDSSEPQSNDDGSLDLGNADCEVNADCEGTIVDENLSQYRCISKELYCVDGQCRGRCNSACTITFTTENPCPSGEYCVPLSLSENDPPYEVCSKVPVTCEDVSDCPLYDPDPNADPQLTWACTDGLCQHPTLSYLTQ